VFFLLLVLSMHFLNLIKMTSWPMNYDFLTYELFECVLKYRDGFIYLLKN
jgi:hypothetical protein